MVSVGAVVHAGVPGMPRRGRGHGERSTSRACLFRSEEDRGDDDGDMDVDVVEVMARPGSTGGEG
jgi:hypothetical protein